MCIRDRLNSIPRPILESPRGSQSTDIIRARSRSRSRHKDLGVEVAHKDRLLSPPPQVKIIMRQFPHLSDRQADACLQTIKEETHACIQTFMDKMRKILGTEDTAKVFNALSVVNSDLSFNMLCAYRSTQECDYRSTQTKCWGGAWRSWKPTKQCYTTFAMHCKFDCTVCCLRDCPCTCSALCLLRTIIAYSGLLQKYTTSTECHSDWLNLS